MGPFFLDKNGFLRQAVMIGQRGGKTPFVPKFL